jgi:hypothetical protein
MKLYVKRRFSYEDAVMKLEDLKELVYVHHGIELVLEEQTKFLEFYTELYNKEENQTEKDKLKKNVDDYTEQVTFLKKLNSELDVHNEIPLEKYTIKRLKVDYAFNCSYNKAATDTYFKVLQEKFPDKRLMSFPNYLMKGATKTIVNGYNGDILITFEPEVKK